MSEDARKQTLNFWIPAQKMGQDGCIVKFYSAHEPVEHVVVKLYEGKSLHDPSEPDLMNLPPGLLKRIQQAGIESKQGDLKRGDVDPDKMNPIEPAIEVYVKVNEEGQVSKRIHWDKTLELWAGRASSAGGASNGEQRAYLGFTPEDETLIGLVSEEVEALVTESLDITERALDERETGVEPSEVFSRTFYQLTYTFKNVRGAATVPVADALADATPVDYGPILDGDITTLAEDIANGHFAIVSAEAARKMVTALGIEINKELQESAELRAEVAGKVWLYADLITRWKREPADAKAFVNEEGKIPW